MLRHLLLAGLAAVAIAACGSSAATQTPAASTGASDVPAASSSSTTPTAAPTTPVSSVTPTGGVTMMTAACDLVGVRKQPTTKGAVEGRIHVGAIVHVVGTVPGDVYSAGSCGTGGTQWLKIDQVDGKSAKLVYGVDFVYAAAGFFK